MSARSPAGFSARAAGGSVFGGRARVASARGRPVRGLGQAAARGVFRGRSGGPARAGGFRSAGGWRGRGHRERRADRVLQPEAQPIEELARRAEAHRRILGQRALDHPVELPRDLVAGGRRIVGALLLHAVDDLLACAGEGRLARDELVDDRADLVEVRARGDAALAELLGRHVLGRALRAAHQAMAAEIGDLHAPLLVEDHVGGLEVAVEDALRVRRLQRFEQLARDLPGLAQVGARALHARGERLALGELRDDAEHLVGLDQLDEGRDRGMAHAREGRRGLAQPREPRLRDRVAIHEFEGHRLLPVGAAIDLRHAALAEERLDLVLADALRSAHATRSSAAVSVASSGGGSMGSVTVTVVPTPGVERTSMRPPCCVTIL